MDDRWSAEGNRENTEEGCVMWQEEGEGIGES